MGTMPYYSVSWCISKAFKKMIALTGQLFDAVKRNLI